ncbi:ACT domain-containing protein [Longibacter salinarum]|nr:ACT domain-containing protein [Longibacter salinarum]
MQILDIVRGALNGAGVTALLLGALRILDIWQAPVEPWILLAVAGAFFVAGAFIPAQDTRPAESNETMGDAGESSSDPLAESLAQAAEALSSRGTSDLGTLLSDMGPVLLDDEFVYLTVPDDPEEWPDALTQAEPIGTFREEEGESWIVARSVADEAEMTYDVVFRGITLSVHSSLTAIGFLAVLTFALSEQGIAVNVVSATYHDHLFVPKERVRETMAVLKGLQAGGSEIQKDVEQA